MVKISLMEVWRPFRRRQLVDPMLVRAVAALDDFLDAIGIDTQPNIEDPEEPEAAKLNMTWTMANLNALKEKKLDYPPLHSYGGTCFDC